MFLKLTSEVYILPEPISEFEKSLQKPISEVEIFTKPSSEIEIFQSEDLKLKSFESQVVK